MQERLQTRKKMTVDKLKKKPVGDSPKPKRSDSCLAQWLEDHLGFRPFGVEW